MPAKNDDLHGNVPDTADVALILIDVINDLEFDSGEEVLRHALPMAEQIKALKRRAKTAGIPVIYVNDNFGKWQSDFNTVLKHCLEEDVCGKPVAELLRPDEDDYFVLKPKHSGFFSTTLDTLLDYLQVKILILTGLTGDICSSSPPTTPTCATFISSSPPTASLPPTRRRTGMRSNICGACSRPTRALRQKSTSTN